MRFARTALAAALAFALAAPFAATAADPQAPSRIPSLAEMPANAQRLAPVVARFRADLVVSVPKGEAGKLKAELLSVQPLVAPVVQGQRVGSLRVSLDGRPVGEYPLLALENVPAAGILGRAWDTLRLWLK